jgi:hypothetical protein
VACRSTHTASSIAADFNRRLVPTPYSPVKIVWTVYGNAFAAATDRHINAASRSFNAGDAGIVLDSTGTFSGSPRKAR